MPLAGVRPLGWAESTVRFSRGRPDKVSLYVYCNMRSLWELFTWTVAMGHGHDVTCRKPAHASLVRPYHSVPRSRWVLNQQICTPIERGTEHYGRTELDIRDPRTSVWAMGPLAHARNVGSRYDHYGTTRRGATPRLGRIDSKIHSGSTRGAGTICTLV